MDDAELRDALQGLGMDRESWRALPLLPLVQVAWADGRVQDAERDMILELASARWHLGEEGLRTLRNWLHHPPSTGYVRRGQQVLVALVEGGEEPDLDADLLGDVVQLSRDVARAAGGYFGFGAIERAEAEALEQIADALHIPSQRRWSLPDDETQIPIDADDESEGPAVTVELHVDALREQRSRGTLIQYDPERGELSAPITDGGLRIGRSRDCDVQISYDARVSRAHCQLLCRDGRFYVRDLESTCGTWVNGERILERRLLGNEEIGVGSVVFFFQLNPADEGDAG